MIRVSVIRPVGPAERAQGNKMAEQPALNEPNTGALITRIYRVWGAHYTMIIIRNPQNSIGNFSGP